MDQSFVFIYQVQIFNGAPCHEGLLVTTFKKKCQLFFLHITSDDAFFNRNWAGACRGRRVGPGLLADWDAGFLNCLG